MKFRVESTVGQHTTGAYVTESDFPDGRAAELVNRGVLTPTDGEFPVPMDTEDLKGLRKRCESLEAQNAKLRTANAGAEQLMRITELEAEVADLKADNVKLQNLNAELSQGVVPIAQHKNLQDQFDQLTRLHESSGDGLDNLTVAQLKVKASEMGLGDVTGTKKADIISAIRELSEKA